MLVKWGCALADKNQIAAYVDATGAGKPLYEKFGFVDHSNSQPNSHGPVSMIREANPVDK